MYHYYENLFSEDVALYYNDYISGLDKTPFFHLTENDNVRQKFITSNYNDLINQIVSLYKSFSEADILEIKNDITGLAKSLSSGNSMETSKNLFSQTLVDIRNPSIPKISIYYTTLEMKKKTGKSTVETQSYTVNRVTYLILKDLISAHANTLHTLTVKDIDDWIKESSSPHNPNVKLCF
ncbi:hypothetical protein [Xenorhabdus bovienii]|uniref:hypothetical protein n=1 Tax=Xenorhabdus bovienii TaxID=40576 RepID=UPI0023B3328E|nr:hypothetical protein [Xenorhabdus bovienii]MDE9535239.1 hypothetical protein [Xenorhabdus bovienii]MDE9588559.1 hypothetical protein [Xenorhabdus bovienii]